MKKSPLKRMSKKRTKEMREYYAMKPIFLKEHPNCECPDWRGMVACPYCSSGIHHMKGRRGKLLINKRFFMPVCPECHVHIEDNKKWARSVGAILYK